MPNPGIISFTAGVAGLLLAFVIYAMVKRQPAGTEIMQRIAAKIHKGAMVFLAAEYKILALFIVVVAGLLFAFWPDSETSYAFIGGGEC